MRAGEIAARAALLRAGELDGTYTAGWSQTEEDTSRG
jgi:hypothetical protein